MKQYEVYRDRDGDLYLVDPTTKTCSWLYDAEIQYLRAKRYLLDRCTEDGRLTRLLEETPLVHRTIQRQEPLMVGTLDKCYRYAPKLAEYL